TAYCLPRRIGVAASNPESHETRGQSAANRFACRRAFRRAVGNVIVTRQAKTGLRSTGQEHRAQSSTSEAKCRDETLGWLGSRDPSVAGVRTCNDPRRFVASRAVRCASLGEVCRWLFNRPMVAPT